jgi:hypothetical protein
MLVSGHSSLANLPAPVAGRSYIFEAGTLSLLRNTVIIAVSFFVPFSLIAVTFVLPLYFLYDLVSWLTDSEVTSWLLMAIILVGSYFATFVIAGEASDVCLGGTASFSKAMYKTSIKGVGRLLGTDMLVTLGVVFVLIIGLCIAWVFSWGDVWILGDFGVFFVLLGLAGWLFLFTTQVVAIERIYWLSALRRSASIVWKSKKRSTVIFVLFLLCMLASRAIPLSILVLGSYITGKEDNILVNMSSSIALAIFFPPPIIFLTLAYYSLRRLSGELSFDVLADIKAYEMS